MQCQFAFDSQGLWMNNSTLITMTTGPGLVCFKILPPGLPRNALTSTPQLDDSSFNLNHSDDGVSIKVSLSPNIEHCYHLWAWCGGGSIRQLLLIKACFALCCKQTPDIHNFRHNSSLVCFYLWSRGVFQWRFIHIVDCISHLYKLSKFR